MSAVLDVVRDHCGVVVKMIHFHDGLGVKITACIIIILIFVFQYSIYKHTCRAARCKTLSEKFIYLNVFTCSVLHERPSSPYSEKMVRDLFNRQFLQTGTLRQTSSSLVMREQFRSQ